MYTTDKTILATGAAGFIGGQLAQAFSGQPGVKLILADDFSSDAKTQNWSALKEAIRIPRESLFDALQEGKICPDWVIHMGARTDTTEFDYSVHERLNLHYSQLIWNYCTQNQIPLIYASSAATYGNGEQGYSDQESSLQTLKPLNPYGLSKHQFDLWVREQSACPPHWYGLKFFNVYGYREAHKGRMASMVYHGYHQILQSGKVKLFKSHRPDFKDGEQLRDFIYVKDIIRVIEWLMLALPANGIYNLGTGQARSFNDLIHALFQALGRPTQIEYIDMPEDIRESYQYYTEASMEKLRAAGYDRPFYSLEDGVADYVQAHLLKERGAH